MLSRDEVRSGGTSKCKLGGPGSPSIQTRRDRHTQRSKRREAKRDHGWPGLQDTRNQSCAMIFGALSEKYRPILAKEAATRAFEEHEKSKRRTRLHRDKALRKLCGGTECFETKAQPTKESTDRQAGPGPHDMTSRLRKLEDPNAPEFPCLCDPDCLCAPLCAGEPEENCLCETDPLFWRVTTGFEIDELLERVLAERHEHERRWQLARMMADGRVNLPSHSDIAGLEAQLAEMGELHFVGFGPHAGKHQAAMADIPPPLVLMIIQGLL